MKILITNDDGYKAKGIEALVRVLRPYGDLTIVAPKSAQSGMSMAVSLGRRPMGVKKLCEEAHERWYYLDGTPASCIKYGIDNIYVTEKPDLVVSGINHGANAATAVLYSGTIGAAMEAAVNRIPGIGISLDSFSEDADFSAVEELLPSILDKLIPQMNKGYGTFYNINFPYLKASEIKGVMCGHMGRAHWEEEYQPFDLERVRSMGVTLPQSDIEMVMENPDGEEFVMMAGNFVDDSDNLDSADHRLTARGYIAISAHNIDNTDYAELERLKTVL